MTQFYTDDKGEKHPIRSSEGYKKSEDKKVVNPHPIKGNRSVKSVNTITRKHRRNPSYTPPEKPKEVQQLVMRQTKGVGYAIFDKKTGDRVSDYHRAKKDGEYILRDYKREAEEGSIKPKKEGYTNH